MNITHPKILIIGEETRSFLSAIRSLGQAGYEVHVICYNRSSPACHSRYIKTIKYYNYQSHTQEEWVDAVLGLIERYQFDVILPCDERAIYPLWMMRAQLPPHTQLAVANDTALDILFDKWKTKKLALSCDIPVAVGRLVNTSAVTYDEVASQLGKRFVVKPLQSFDQEALITRKNVTIVRKAADYDECRSNDSSVMVESYFHGEGEGVSIFAVEGEIKTYFSHRRAAESSGGGSSYRHSIQTDPDQLAAVAKMCRRVGYTGVAMFEFRRNRETNAWILVEVNARLWGSLPLAIFCGVDFPRYYIDYLLAKKLPEQTLNDYPINRYARALTTDLYAIRRESEGPNGGRDALRRLFKYSRIITGREILDSFSWRDTSPFFHEIRLIVSLLANALSKKMSLFVKMRGFITKYHLKKLMADNPNRRLVFICYGNIMRSPFAEQVLRNQLGDKSNEIVTESYGFHAFENRESPTNARAAASALNHNLDKHRSRCLRQNDLRSSDVLFYFDEKNKAMLASYYQAHNAFYIHDLIPVSKAKYYEVADPYGLDTEGVRHCYELIELSVKQLVNYCKGGHYER